MLERFLNRILGDLVKGDPVHLLFIIGPVYLQGLYEMPGYRLSFTVRVGSKEYVIRFFYFFLIRKRLQSHRILFTFVSR